MEYMEGDNFTMDNLDGEYFKVIFSITFTEESVKRMLRFDVSDSVLSIFE